MITQHIKFLYNNDITFAELVILMYLNNQLPDTDFYNYVNLFETREKNYVYDRININIVYDLIERNLISSKTKENTFVEKLILTLDTLLLSYNVTKKGIDVLNKYNDIFNNTAKINNLIHIDNNITLLQEICNYWYDDRKVPYKTNSVSDNNALVTAFNKFREDNPEFSDEAIRRATYLYFEEYRRNNSKKEDGIVDYSYLTNQLDFISGNKTVSLLKYCNNSKNSNVLIAKNIIALD